MSSAAWLKSQNNLHLIEYLVDSDERKGNKHELASAFDTAFVSPQKRIHAVEFIAQIPRSAAGKILRRPLIRR